MQYEGIFNQCLVLTVSYFASTITSLFRQTINYAGQNSPFLIEASNEDLKISLSELRQYDFDLRNNLGDLIIRKKDFSFQDMQSVSRSFKTFLNIDIIKDQDLNNIIMAQASRHAIVHSLATSDEKFMKQIRDANPRDVLNNIEFGQQIKYQPDDIYKVIQSMKIQLLKIIESIDRRVNQKVSYG
jgi:predicted AAA+ superfamily ATPase